MRIAIINTLYPPTTVGGAERSVAVLAEGLARTGHDVHAIVLDDVGSVRTETVVSVRVHRLPHGNAYWPFDGKQRGKLEKAAWHLRDRGKATVEDSVAELLNQIAPDVLHTNNLTGFGSGIVPMARRMGLPVVHTLRDFSLLCARASLFRDGQDCTRRCIACRAITTPRIRTAADVDVVVGNSTYMIEQHRAFGMFRATAAKTIYNAVPELPDAPRRTDAHGSPFRFGFAGAIKPEKGIGILLDACRRLPESGWSLAIAGRGNEGYLAHLKNKYAGLPLTWLGFVPIERFLADVDLTVIPSIWPEPMPRTLIETLASGLPAIVSDAGGSKEVAAMSPHARVYPKRDISALAELMQDSIATGRQNIAIDGDLTHRFSVERLVGEYVEVYRQAVSLRATDPS
ncbi:glycosyltransferase family 4 protein [Croceicoccus bisphenolivorans]|uniref:glycosyltransferase family 4 protein n=1 Tax=Croceicoccus bisphenolivorans TaxID=1783232 RepID=UPI00082CC5A2|nr:glycosyltransferase family 4 protein [Croceicoccus bisphenolivorans]